MEDLALMNRSAGVGQPCVKRFPWYPVGLANLYHRERLTVNQIVGGIGPDLQNRLDLLDCQGILRKFTHENPPFAPRAEEYSVFKVHCWLVRLLYDNSLSNASPLPALPRIYFYFLTPLKRVQNKWMLSGSLTGEHPFISVV